MDFRHYMQGFTVLLLLSKEDFAYMFKKIDEPLPHSLNPFKVNEHIAKALMKKVDEIKRETLISPEDHAGEWETS